MFSSGDHLPDHNIDPPHDDSEERLGRFILARSVEIDDTLDLLEALCSAAEADGLSVEDLRRARENVADFLRPFYLGFNVRDRVRKEQPKCLAT